MDESVNYDPEDSFDQIEPQPISEADLYDLIQETGGDVRVVVR